MATEDAPTVIHEWTDEREAGGLGFRIIFGGDGDPWLEMRTEDDGVWTDWEEEDLDGPGADVLWQLPNILAAERARIRRELLEAISDQRTAWSLAKPLGEEGVKTDRELGADSAFAALLTALGRICPPEKGE